MTPLVDGKRPSSHSEVFGRQNELDWLDLSRRRGGPIVISGPPGVGKTTLLQKFLANVRTRRPPASWTLIGHPNEAMVDVTARIDELYREKSTPEIVAIDGAEALSSSDMNSVAESLLNLKSVRTVIFATRRRPDVARAEILEIGPLSNIHAEEMLRRLLGGQLAESAVSRAVAAAGGLPLALGLLSELLRGREPQETGKLLKGEIYDLREGLILPKKKLIRAIQPQIMLANEALVEKLKRQPRSVYELPPRKFEELVAELLSDLGYEVELTPARPLELRQPWQPG